MGVLKDITGQHFGEWEVIEYNGDGTWKCKCSCGTINNIKGTMLRSGKTTKCKKHPKKDIIGKVIEPWMVIEYIGDSYYKCECIYCHRVNNIRADYLQDGHRVINCTCQGNRDQLKDLTGKTFGYLLVKQYLGNKTYKCECTKCGKKDVIVLKHRLTSGQTRSCGCASTELFKNTMIERYGETNVSKIKNPREQWQIDAVSNKENLKNYINSLGKDKVDINDLCNNLGLNKTNMYLKIHAYELDDYVEHNYNASHKEKELLQYIKSIIPNVMNNVKDVISPYELDIYIPDKHIAIEFNGTYWHSDVYKDKMYHQNKTIDCAKKGIRLIHIFEYEWDNEWDNDKDKIKRFLYNILSDDSIKIFARNTQVKEITSSETSDFLNRYHLQGSAPASIHIGCYYENELIGVLTIGKPRFSDEYQYEIIRLCWKSNIKVVGGTEKLFDYFIKNYNPKSIITYVNISKFTGNSYLRLGFKPIGTKSITVPNYVWTDGYSVLSRYQTQKSKISDDSNINETEDTIMENKGFMKIYDCGNIKLEFRI